MKKIYKALVAVASLGLANAALATPVTVTLTGDNIITAGTSICGANLGGCINYTGTGTNLSDWTVADSFTFELDDGYYEFVFQVNNTLPWPSYNPAGLLAEITWGTNVNSSSSSWIVTAPASEAGSAVEYGANGSSGIWSTVAGIGSDAQWLWTANNDGTADGTDSYAYFRTSITVPEPATLALFGLGLLGFGIARRRKV